MRKSMTLKRLEKTLINLIKEINPEAKNARVIKSSGRDYFTILVDLKYPDLINNGPDQLIKGDCPMEGSYEFTWKAGENLKTQDELGVQYLSFGFEDGRFFYSVDGLGAKDYFYDSTGYGIIKDGEAITSLNKKMAEYNLYFEPNYSSTGVHDVAYSL